ncbi:deoxyribodipyrimidine photo-lyase [Marinimicrobium locisalis]|uniref:deoxyribodipyrimidine photo-lyase n=1 Tax=Marinimicrobium locisalis TaxID=546022 RepID=UPI003221BE65
MRALVWLRNDLRLRDNPALYHAAEERQGVVAVYVLCERFIERHETAPARLDFIRRHLSILQKDLAQRGIPLVLLRVREAGEIPTRLLALARHENCDRLYFNAEYPLDELNRDRQVADAALADGLHFKRFHDRVILPPGEVRNGQGEPYRVFTAFKKRWLQLASGLAMAPHGLPPRQPETLNSLTTRGLSLEQLFQRLALRDLAHLWPAGEEQALARLSEFCDEAIGDYKALRDFPAEPATSELSPYLAVGSVSPRQCLTAALRANDGRWDGGREGVATWIGELVWRDFYQHVVVDFPQVCQRKPLQTYTEGFPWRWDQADFNRWRRGETGIPIVDAAMRQLAQTGWMHNRLRMVTAMFLTKNLRIDWRMGESWFMSQLIDGDFSANNGGWQWSASTGTDAAPYFRIFNPVTQSERFDPNGRFIRKYVPELKALSDKAIHDPPPVSGYPKPMVDLKASRQDTIALFKALHGHRKSETGDE